MTGKPVVLCAHARAQRRGLDEATILAVATAPGQILSVRPGREIRQARRADPATGREYIVRVVVDTDGPTDAVVTVYRSSKLDKYWRMP